MKKPRGKWLHNTVAMKPGESGEQRDRALYCVIEEGQCWQCQRTLRIGELYTRNTKGPVCWNCQPFVKPANSQVTQGEEKGAEEGAFRRGWAQGTEEAVQLVLQLVSRGYNTTVIKRLIAVYDDHFVKPWRSSDLEKRTAPPPFNLERCQELAKTKGYDWII